MKQRLREQAQKKRASKPAAAAIQRRLMEQDWWVAGFQTGIYRATPNEPSTDALLADLLARGARVAVPARKGREYGWGWIDETTRWRKGAHGIQEPAAAKPAKPGDLRVVVVPGVAFDAQGGRLGRGGGHFDRLLAQSQALLVGLCFANRLVAAIPMAPHDIRMDVVVTEKQVFFAPAAEAKLERLLGGGGAHPA